MTGDKFERARHKLRQSEILRGELHAASDEIAIAQRRACSSEDQHRLLLETYFFACLNATQSAFFIVDNKDTAPDVRRASAQWRQDLEQREQERFNKLVDMRGNDVHLGESRAVVLPKMIPIANDDGSVYQHRNPGIFGQNPPTEFVNPDGKTVVGRYGLMGSIGLYVDFGAERIEGIDACTWFIEKLYRYIAAVEASIQCN